MSMPYSQYCRIESKAGGVGCTDKEFIRAALTLLKPEARGYLHREARHKWLRAGLARKREELKLFRRFG